MNTGCVVSLDIIQLQDRVKRGNLFGKNRAKNQYKQQYNTIASQVVETGDGIVSSNSFSMKSELEGEWATLAPIDRNTLQRRFSLVVLPTLVFAFAPGFYPISACREVNIT